jgi:hypothetical protein
VMVAMYCNVLLIFLPINTVCTKRYNFRYQDSIACACEFSKCHISDTNNEPCKILLFIVVVQYTIFV